jgi:hypothetical protein
MASPECSLWVLEVVVTKSFADRLGSSTIYVQRGAGAYMHTYLGCYPTFN